MIAECDQLIANLGMEPFYVDSDELDAKRQEKLDAEKKAKEEEERRAKELEELRNKCERDVTVTPS